MLVASVNKKIFCSCYVVACTLLSFVCLMHFFKCFWVILPNLVHTGFLQFLAIFHNLAGNEHGLLVKTTKTPINTLKLSKFFFNFDSFPVFFPNYSASFDSRPLRFFS